jgi:DNA-binding transcriptional regulator LsrR (DeoR family)
MWNSGITEELIEKIEAAGPQITDAQLARDLGIHRNTVRKYRKEARAERQEVAREILAQHVEANIPDALKDLTDLRKIVREKFEATKDPKDGNLWLAAIKTTLEHVAPDDADLDRAIDAELARLAGKVPAAGAPADATAAVAASVH